MPRYRAEDLRKFTAEVFRREGVPEDAVELIADHLVHANLAGMDSHGVLRIPQYIELMRSGTIDGVPFYTIDPHAAFEIVEDHGAVVSVDGHYNFGMVTTSKAVRLAIERARRHGISVACRGTTHIGRLGEYASQIARDDMVGIIFCNVGRIVAPFGGSDRKLGTNPFCVGIPTGSDDPFVLDYATSCASEGKIRAMNLGGKRIPLGWIVDKHGRDTDTPGDLYDDGAILPFGGDQSYKGYGLGLMVEMLGAMLTRTGFPGYPGYQFGTSGVVITVYDIARFTEIELFKSGIDQLVHAVKGSRLRPGVKEILIPGELESRNTAENSMKGIELSEEAIALLTAVAAGHDMRLQDYLVG